MISHSFEGTERLFQNLQDEACKAIRTAEFRSTVDYPEGRAAPKRRVRLIWNYDLKEPGVTPSGNLRRPVGTSVFAKARLWLSTPRRTACTDHERDVDRRVPYHMRLPSFRVAQRRATRSRTEYPPGHKKLSVERGGGGKFPNSHFSQSGHDGANTILAPFKKRSARGRGTGADGYLEIGQHEWHLLKNSRELLGSRVLTALSSWCIRRFKFANAAASFPPQGSEMECQWQPFCQRTNYGAFKCLTVDRFCSVLV